MAKYEDLGEYRIFGGNTLADLETEVNRYMKVGYKPQGSIFSLFGSSCVYQPMLRLADKDKSEMTEGLG